MRAVFGLVLLVGLALAGAAVYMIQGHIKQTEILLAQERALNAKAGKLVQVYVFTKEIKRGEPLTKEAVKLIFWPEKDMPKGIFREEAALFPENAPGPRYARRDTLPLEPVLPGRVTEPGELTGLTAKLQAGMRAFQIRVGTATGVAGFVQPDDFIDIYWTGSARGITGEVTQLIESAIEVIAVDNEISGEISGSARTVTVAATPDQVARLAQAMSTGRLAMSLVGDPADVITSGIEVDTKGLLGIQEKVVEKKEAKKVCKVKSRKGSEIIETVVDCPEE